MEEKRERALVTCEECGVEFFGKPKQRFCPMHLREHHRENLRRERERKKKRGRCYDCGRPVEPGKSRCAACLAKNREHYKNIGLIGGTT